MESNVTSTSNGMLNSPETELITNSALSILRFIFKFTINPCLAVTGICVSVINIVVFLKMGLSDGVSQNFFILSLSDGFLATVGTMNSAGYISEFILRKYKSLAGSAADAQTVHWLCYFINMFPISISMITTVVIAVVRCCCVAMPLKVKAVITVRRQLVAIFVPSTIYFAVVLYTYHSMYILYVFDPQTNDTYASLRGADWLTLTFFQNILTSAAYAIVIVCVVILSVNLRRSSKFRDMSTSTSSQINSISASSKTGPSLKPKSKERSRDVRVIQTVVLVSVFFIICNAGVIIYIITHLVVTGFKSHGKYHNSNEFSLMIVEMLTFINVVVNICIYSSYNSRYRAILHSMFRLDRNEQS